MKSWKYTLTGILCAAICISSVADAGIGNQPQPQKAQALQIKGQNKRSTQSNTTIASKKIKESKNHAASGGLRRSSTSRFAYSISDSKQTSKSASSVPSTAPKKSLKKQSPKVPSHILPQNLQPPVHTQLVIKKLHPRKKSKSKKGQGNLIRGRRGKDGRDGKRGKKGEKGDPGNYSGPTGFISALNPNSTATIAAGDTIKSFQVINNSFISFDPVSGVFTSHAGPGFYEIHYGASWDGQCALVLKVDGKEVNPFIDLNSPASTSKESIIVNSGESSPTFALGNLGSAPAAMTLTNKGVYSSAFITIKKLN